MMRIFRDRDGSEWRAWEVKPITRVYVDRRVADMGRPADVGDPDSDPRDRRVGDVQRGWVAFEKGGELRRLYPVPPDWEGLAEERLDLLRRMAIPVSRRLDEKPVEWPHPEPELP